MTRYTAIPAAVKKAVAERDSINGRCCCILCGSPYASPSAHIVRRSQGGQGVEENIVSLCADCHRRMDEGEGDLMDRAIAYIKSKYPGWNPERVTYKKWR